MFALRILACLAWLRWFGLVWCVGVFVFAHERCWLGTLSVVCFHVHELYPRFRLFHVCLTHVGGALLLDCAVGKRCIGVSVSCPHALFVVPLLVCWSLFLVENKALRLARVRTRTSLLKSSTRSG